MTWRRTATLLALGALLLVGAGRAGGQVPDDTPSIVLSIGAATTGQQVVVTGTGWPATVGVTTMVCGQSGRGGTATCDVLGGQTLVTDASGSFRTTLTIRIPPEPCPCVVRSASASGGSEVSTPLAIVAAPYTPPASEPTTSTTSTTAPGPPGTTRASSTSTDFLFAPWGSTAWLAVLGGSGGFLVLLIATTLLVRRRRRRRRTASAAVPGTPVFDQDGSHQAPTASTQPPALPEPSPIAGGLPGPSGAKLPKLVVFSLPDIGPVKTVSVCGDFNAWAPDATPLHVAHGRWSVTVPLERGQSYRYRFLIDGERWMNDPSDPASASNPFGTIITIDG